MAAPDHRFPRAMAITPARARSEGPSDERTPVLAIFLVFLKLGLTSFGGPVAHLGYFRQEFVERRKWLGDHAYADLVALCQFLPGPASSQVGIAVGLFRGGLPGALASWLGFTLPSAIALVVFGLALAGLGEGGHGAWLHGLKVVAVAVVAQALWSMGRNLCPDRARASLAVGAAVLAIAMPGAAAQVGTILAGAVAGRLWLPPGPALPHSPLPVRMRRRTGALFLAACLALLVVLPAAAAHGDYAVALFDRFFRAGALVFGGGHVVLPLLQASVVPPGWVSEDAFLAGYGAAQAVPGPLFTFAAYLGAVSTGSPSGWVGAALALVAIFLPAFLLVIGALPLWEGARRHPAMRRAMAGVNAAVVGLLLAAFYRPVWTSAILSAADFALAAVAFLLLVFWKLPPWLVVVLTALAAGLGWH